MRRLIALLVVSGCSDPPTTVRLEIIAAPELALDGLAIMLDGTRHEETLTESLQLLLPDRFVGIAQRIDVAGTRDGATVAAGTVEVTPIAGQEVARTVVLVDLSCDPVCALGDRGCERDGVVTCELGPDRCPIWSDPVACPRAMRFCSSGACSDRCTDECTSGETICAGTKVKTCGELDSDSCREFGAPTSCPSGQVCAADACTPAFALTVVKAGTGTGGVTASPSGLACGASCTASYAAGTQVTLTATPDSGVGFVGWSGSGCSGVAPCVITPSTNIQVTATFDVLLRCECPDLQTCCLANAANDVDVVNCNFLALTCGMSLGVDPNPSTFVHANCPTMTCL